RSGAPGTQNRFRRGSRRQGRVSADRGEVPPGKRLGRGGWAESRRASRCGGSRQDSGRRYRQACQNCIGRRQLRRGIAAGGFSSRGFTPRGAGGTEEVTLG